MLALNIVCFAHASPSDFLHTMREASCPKSCRRMVFCRQWWSTGTAAAACRCGIWRKSM